MSKQHILNVTALAGLGNGCLGRRRAAAVPLADPKDLFASEPY